MARNETVVFASASSAFNKGLTVQASFGVIFSESVTNKNANVTMSTGTGTLTVVAGKVISTTGQALTVTGDDVNLEGSVSTGSSAVTLNCQTPLLTVGLGSVPGVAGDENRTIAYRVSGTELQHVTATGMVLGDSTCGTITVGGVTEANSNAISDVFSILAAKDEVEIFHFSA